MFINAYTSWPSHEDNEILIRREAILTLTKTDTRGIWRATLFTGAEPMTVWVPEASIESLLED